MNLKKFFLGTIVLHGAFLTAGNFKSETPEKLELFSGAIVYNEAVSSDLGVTDEKIQTNLRELNIEPVLQEMLKKAKAACRLSILPSSITLSAGVVSATWNLDKLCHQ